MRRIIHLSDLHFGRVDSGLLNPLTNFINSSGCDLAVISGDLTQRATTAQFLKAKAFLADLKVEQIVIPGNHDIPLYKLWIRLTKPFTNFNKHITSELEPSFIGPKFAVFGISTVSLWTSGGAFRKKTFSRLAERINNLPDNLIKVLVSHHPLPLKILKENGLRFDVLLAGHNHVQEFSLNTISESSGQLFILAGTATSTRLRDGFCNSFNIIDIDENFIKVTHVDWFSEENIFRSTKEGSFVKIENRWTRKEAEGQSSILKAS